MTLLDRDQVSRRLLKLNECLEMLATPDAGDGAALEHDMRLRAAVERWIQVAIESCVDIAYHVVASSGWTPPESARGAFQVLARHGRLEDKLADRLGRAAGLRNILVHDYASVDLEILARSVREDLGDLRAFGQAVARWLGSE